MPKDDLQKQLMREIESFQGMWKGGYHEGDPVDLVAEEIGESGRRLASRVEEATNGQ